MAKITKPNLTKPEIFGSVDVWGHILNENIDKTSLFMGEAIIDLESKDQELARLEKDKANVKDIAPIVENKVDNYVETNVKPQINNYLDITSKPNLDAYVEQKKTDLDNYNNTVKKPELDNYEKTKETELNQYANTEKEAITNHTTSKITEITSHTDSEKTRLTTHTNNEIKKIQDEGTTQKNLVTQEGGTQTQAVTAEGNKQVQKVIEAGGALNTRVDNLESNKLDKGDLPSALTSGKDLYNIIEKQTGATFDPALLYLNDAGTKQAGKLYFDRLKPGVFKCITQTTGTVNSTTNFVDISNLENANRLSNLSKELPNRINEYNSNATQKTSEFDTHVNDKLATCSTDLENKTSVEVNKTIEQVKKLVGVNPAGGDAVSVGGKTRVEFEKDVENLKVTLFGEKSDLSEIINRYNMINPANIVRGTVNMSGVIAESESSDYDVIKYIPVEAGKTYGMSYKISTGGRTVLIPQRVVFYNERKEFVEQATSEGEHTNFITKNKPYGKNVFGITTKSNGYICFQVSHGLQEIMFYSDLSDEYVGIFTPSSNAKIKDRTVKEIHLSDELKTKFNSIGDVNGIMSEVVNAKELPYNLLNPTESILGTLGTNGNVFENSASPYFVSDFILLKANIDYNLSYFNKNYNDRYNLSPQRWCFYDVNNKAFKNQSTDLTQNKIDYVEEEVKYGAGGYRKIRTTQDVYLRFQYGNDLQEPQVIEGLDPTYVPSFTTIKKYGLKDKIIGINNLSDELKIKIETGASKSIDDIYRFAFCKLHKNVLCIGDSLTEGYHNPDDIRRNMSYPSHLSSLAGYTVKNMGQSGITALGWWNAYKDKDTFTKYDAVFIYLGTNGGLTDTIDEDTASGDYNTFAQTNTGGYCAIVAKIKAVNPKCKIYLIQYNNITATSKVTAKIAKKYGCITLLVTDNSVFNLTDSKYHTDATHYNSIGYWAFACVMLVQVEKYIAGHVNDYIDLK